MVAPLSKEMTRNYVDDIFGCSKEDRDLVVRFRNLLKICREKRVRLKGSKCHVGYDRIEVLGFIVTREGRKILPARTEAITNLPSPQNVTDLRSVIGQIGFVAEFIPDVQRTLRPLHDLITADEFHWGTAEQTAYDHLKDALVSDTVLVHPDLSRPWRLETDASLAGVGGVLWQQTDTGWGVVTYYSKSFNKTQQRWSTFDQEMFGLLYCLSRPDMAPMIKAHGDLTVYTDHRNLVFLSVKSGDTRKHLRWLMILQEYSFKIIHIAGKDNKVADLLSRYGVSGEGESLNNVADADGLREAQQQAPEEERLGWSGPAFAVTDGVVRRNGLLVIPRSAPELVRNVLEDAHRYHGGVNATRANVEQLGFTWLGISHDVQKHVRDCVLCQKTRLSNFVSVNLGDTSRSRPFETVAIDTIGPINTDSAGNRYIFVLVDMFSRYTELVPAPSNNAQAASHALWTSVIARHGVPESILSDNGPEYVNRVVAALTERLEITHHRTIPYRPSSNGVVERRNQEIMRHVRLLAAEFDQYHNWSTVILPYTQMVLNSTQHTTTGFAPMEVLYGTHAMPRRFLLSSEDEQRPDDPLASIQDYITQLTTHLKAVQETALAEQAAARRERGVEPHRVEPGDIVLRTNQRKTKLHGHLGPFKVVAVLDNYAVQVAPVLGGEPVTVHVEQLIPVASDWDEG